MKILTLGFANLNSLEGRWEIDFTHPEYVADGIFAITGPTGSGKSTILDALCLALYGQTPRLGKITKSTNELMSRHTGECFAEVTFSTGRGTFRCRWDQHRARRRAGGELQAQKHEISDALTGQIIQSKIQETLASVEEITGMDFDRFTRSMLLAQGGFAAFLQADPDRRAPVLEQITGTKVYSTISMRVHERQRAERSRLDLLRAEGDGIRTLSEDELSEIEARHLGCLEAEHELTRQLDEATVELLRIQELERLERALSDIDRELEALSAERDAFAPGQMRLDRARNAALIESRHAPLHLHRTEMQRALGELAALSDRRPALQAALREAESRHADALAALNSAIDAGSLAKPLVAKVKALDGRISEKRLAHDLLAHELEDLHGRFTKLAEERTAAREALEAATTTLGELHAWIEANRSDAPLLSVLSGLQHACDELRPAAERVSSSSGAEVAARATLEELRNHLAELEPRTLESKNRAASSGEHVDRLKSESVVLLDGRSLKSLRADLDRLRDRRQALGEIASLYVSGKELAPKISALTSEIQVLEAEKADTERTLAHARQLLEGAEREVALHQETLRLADRVRSFEEERERLSEGSPCPLCGSLHHPYAAPGSAMPGRDESELLIARQALQRHAETIRTLAGSIAGHAAGIEQRERRCAELAEEREALGRRCLALLQGAGMKLPAREAESEVLDALDLVDTQLALLARKIDDAEALDERIGEAEAECLRHRDAFIADQHSLEQAGERISSVTAELRRLELEHESASRELDARKLALQRLLMPYADGMDLSGDPGLLIAGLAARSRRWEDQESLYRKHEQATTGYGATLKSLEAQLGILGDERKKRELPFSEAERELENLVSERRHLFGEQDPEVEEARLDRLTQEARSGLELANGIMAAARQEIGIVDKSMETLRSGISERQKELRELEKLFLNELSSRGFDDESAFLDARLSEEERERLEQHALELQHREQEVAARRAERTIRLGQVRSEKVDLRSSEELATAVEQHRESLRAVREAIGALRQQLAGNEQATEAQRRIRANVDGQVIECRRWDALHDIIGSADGKKYRNFAQGLTFEIMVAHANHQLVHMTDRYLLVRDCEVPLELNVIDNWQAGEVRSTRNLSGGESFIVSLALALGLSQMSSRNVRVDSLFLDEGFGTLDEEALETALETLAGLQQRGKLVGVISHVSALKERIATRISVTSISGGRSAISGPGTRRI